MKAFSIANHARQTLAATAVALLLMGTASAAKVSATVNDSGVDLQRIHTFNFGPMKAGDKIADQFFLQHAQREVAYDLTRREGWQWVNTGGDVVVTILGGQRSPQQYVNFYRMLGQRWNENNSGDTFQPGTLVVDLYQKGTHRLLFRGTAANETTTDLNLNTGKLDNAIDRMFSQLPARPMAPDSDFQGQWHISPL